MKNKDKFIRDTEFGKLMENKTEGATCLKCKYYKELDSLCIVLTNAKCFSEINAYFAKDETEEENKNG